MVGKNQPKAPGASRSLAVGLLLLFVVMTPVLYFLSVGPVGLLVSQGHVSLEFYLAIYLPLAWLAENFQPVERFFEWYMALWIE